VIGRGTESGTGQCFGKEREDAPEIPELAQPVDPESVQGNDGRTLAVVVVGVVVGDPHAVEGSEGIHRVAARFNLDILTSPRAKCPFEQQNVIPSSE